MKNVNISDRRRYKIFQKNTRTLKTIFSNTKSKVYKKEKSSVVYKIKYRGDNSSACEQIYIGTIKSKLKTRITYGVISKLYSRHLMREKYTYRTLAT